LTNHELADNLADREVLTARVAESTMLAHIPSDCMSVNLSQELDVVAGYLF
jgi:hypothetical protein